MKRINLILLFCLSLAITLHGQDKPFVANADVIATSVVNLLMPIKDGVYKSGTGSLFIKGDKYYIITASHVAKSMDKSTIIVLQGKDNKPVKLTLNDLAWPVKWQHHKKADLAIIQLNPDRKTQELYLKYHFIPYSVVDTSEVPISRNTQLTIIGFPFNMGSQDYFSPLTFRTFPSSSFINLIRADTLIKQTFIALENPSIGGYSGGPVYDLGIIQSGGIMTINSGKTVLHGIIHGNIIDDEGGKVAVITPAFYLKDFFK